MVTYRFDPRWSDVDPIEPGGRVYYGHLTEDPNGEWLKVPFTFWGDYSGSTVERSNYRVLLDEYRNHVVDVYGGYGTAGLLVSRDWFASEEGEEFREIIEGLDNYPVVNEDDWSDLERELEDEDWDSWLCQNVRMDLADTPGIDDLSDDDLFQLWCEVTRTHRSGDYVHFESAASGTYDMDYLVPALDRIIRAYGYREWQTEGDRHWLNVAMLGLLSVLNQDAAKTQCRQWNDHSHEVMTDRLRVCLDEALPYGWEVEIGRDYEIHGGYVYRWRVAVPSYFQ